MTKNTEDRPLAVFGAFSGRLEETTCPICVCPPSPRLIFKRRDAVGIWMCPKCGVYYASPRFDEPALLDIYENEAFTDLSMYDNWSYSAWQQSGRRSWVVSNLKTQLVKRYLRDGDRVLDVGCGTGEFVSVARRNGLDAEGVDNSRMLTEIGRSILRVPVHQVDISSFRPAYKFKGIVIWDVLEHLYDPVEVLRRCGALLEPGGLLFAQVPNHRGVSNRLKSFACRYGLSRNDYGHFGFPYHLYFFDRQSLAALAGAAGLDAQRFESWSRLLKDGQRGVLTDIVIAITRTYCLSDYISVVARKRP